MTREELLRSKEYWIAEIQLDLYELIENYLEKNKLSRIQFAEKLGVTKGYVSQILNGEYDHRISKFVDLAMTIGKVPRIEFEDIEQILIDDMDNSLHKPKNERPSAVNLIINPDSKITLPNQESEDITAYESSTSKISHHFEINQKSKYEEAKTQQYA